MRLNEKKNLRPTLNEGEKNKPFVYLGGNDNEADFHSAYGSNLLTQSAAGPQKRLLPAAQ